MEAFLCVCLCFFVSCSVALSSVVLCAPLVGLQFVGQAQLILLQSLGTVVVVVAIGHRHRRRRRRCCRQLLRLGLLVALHVEVHEKAEEDGRIQQQERRNKLGELALVTEESPRCVHNAEHELGLQEGRREWRSDERKKARESMRSQQRAEC